MTVKQLIKKLFKCDLEATVIILNGFIARQQI